MRSTRCASCAYQAGSLARRDFRREYGASRLLSSYDRPPKIDYIACLKTKRLTQALERVDAWPAHAQDELAEIARDIDESLSKGEYEPTLAELAGIDRGLRDAADGRFASDKQVDAALAKLRGA
jgi:hypothetical protein